MIRNAKSPGVEDPATPVPLGPPSDVPPGDGCDTNLAKPCTAGESARRQRFLDAYRQLPVVAPAARLAGVHRATVYRWRADPAFVAAMGEAADEFFRAHRAKVMAAGAARARWRAEREAARRPMRCYYLALARAAKRARR